MPLRQLYTMRCTSLILVSCVGLVMCRPQDPRTLETKDVVADPPVEIERQLIHEVIPLSNTDGLPNTHLSSQAKTDATTREILEKIAEVNRKQGLLRKKPKPNYFHFPFSYSRSQGDEQRSSDFKFPRDPFGNPIFDYLEKEESNNKDEDETPTFRRPNLDSQHGPENFGLGATDINSKVAAEDNIPGQYIKRKITHYQSFLVPHPSMFNIGPSPATFLPTSGFGMNPPPSPQMPPGPPVNDNILFPSRQYDGQPIYPYYPVPIITPNAPQQLEQNKNEASMEKETINNIKGIVSGGQLLGGPYGMQNNMHLNQQNYLPNNLPMLPPNMLPVNNNRVNSRVLPQGRQNWNWPGANLFPIYIRDPFLQMYYAVTNMVEYGPSAGNEGPCKLTPRPQGSRIKPNSNKAPSKNKSKGQQVTFEMSKKEGTEEIEVAELEASDLTDDLRYLDVEEIDIGDDDLVRFTINLPNASPSGGRRLKDVKKEEKMSWDEYIKSRNNTLLSHLVSDKLGFSPETKESPPIKIKDQTLQVEELEDEPVESEKAEDISISNQGTRKVFSKDNTGNGIFIHKLKVRKGGVAIAGPGGIATAGSGGTAIVGPNGVAYTHPNGLAIAGSGTKVVAVDPTIDLNEVIKDTVLNVNGTRHVANTRVGKVVAVGPVVYYNRG